MGLFGKGKSGGLMNVIRCDEKEYMVWKWRQGGQGVSSTTLENSISWTELTIQIDKNMDVFSKIKDQALNCINKLAGNLKVRIVNVQNQQETMIPSLSVSSNSSSAVYDGIFGGYMGKLNNMALADGKLTEKEKQVLFKKAEFPFYYVKAALLLFVLCFAVTLNAQVMLPEKPNRPQYKDYSQKDNGFWYAVEASGGSSVIINKKNIQWAEGVFTGGFRFNEYLRLGIGLGVRNYFAGNDIVRKNKHSWAMPIFANVRGNIISHESREFVPYGSFSIGSVIGDGVFISPTIGLRIGQPRNSFLIGIAYTLGYIDVDNAVYSECINHYSIKIGYEF